MKKKILIPIIILVIISVLGIYFYKESIKLVYKDSLTIQVGDTIPTIKDYTDNDKASKITWSKIKKEDNKVYNYGHYKGSFTYRKNTYNIKLKVDDKKEPTISNVKDIETYLNKEIDLKKDIKIEDNSHDDIKINIEGEYNIKKVGTYNLKVIAIDKANNKASKDFKLIVKEEPKVEENTTQNQKTKVVGSTTSKGYKVENRNGLYYINNILVVNKTYSIPSTYNPGGLTSTFNNAFSTMQKDASNQGISLKVISGFRSYATQNRIYNNYVSRDGRAAADRYSARPGHSEHQTGLAADINSLSQSFINTKEGKWLNSNMHKYGFILRYPSGKESQTGYMYEPWHIRYVGTNLSNQLYNNGNWITLEEYLGITSIY